MRFFLLTITVLILMISPPLKTAQINVTYFAGSSGHFILTPTDLTVNNQIILNGNSTYNTLMAQMRLKNSSTQRKYEMPLIGTNFTWTLPARDGKGDYEVTVFAHLPGTSTYRGMAKFSFTALSNYPATLIDAAAERMIYYDAAKNTFFVTPPPLLIGYKLPIRGNSKYKNFMIEITKRNSGIKHELKFSLTEASNFNWIYYTRDGAGEYSISLLGNMAGGQNYTGLCSFNVTAQSNYPKDLPGMDLNRQIFDFALARTNQCIGRGECWDLPAEGLDKYNADWSRPYNFGQHLDSAKDEIRPGDIIQMFSLKLVSKLANGTTRIEYFGLPAHTAVIEKILRKNVYLLLNQNVGGKRYVVHTTLDLNILVSGRYDFYRPKAGLIPEK